MVFSSSSCFRRLPTVSIGLILCAILLSHGAAPSTDKNRHGDDENHTNEMRLRADLGLPLDGDGVLHNYSHILPPHNSSSPVMISIALTPILVHQVDAKTQTMTMEGWLKLQWNDTRFSWKKEDYGGLAVIRVPDHQLWQPDIKIYNAATGSDIVDRKGVYCLVYATGDVIWVPPTTMHTICEVNLRHYPYDTQSCQIKIGSWTYSGHHLNMSLSETPSPNKVDLADTFNTAGEWEIVDTSSQRNEKKYPCCEESYSDVTFTLHLRRRSPLHGATIVCPVVAAVVLALVAFWLPPYANERITINAVSLVILMLVLMHLANVIPPAGSRSPIIVCFCGFFIVLVAISTAISVFVITFLRGRQRQSVPHCVHALLRSTVASVCCINTASGSFVIGGGDTAKLEVLQDCEDPQQQSSSSSSGEMIKQADRNNWVCFFQLLDRVAFAFFALVTLLVILLSSV